MEVSRGSAVIIDDAYNANPDSMRHALKTLAHLPGPPPSPCSVRCWAREDSVRLHDEIGRLRA